MSHVRILFFKKKNFFHFGYLSYSKVWPYPTTNQIRLSPKTASAQQSNTLSNTLKRCNSRRHTSIRTSGRRLELIFTIKCPCTHNGQGGPVPSACPFPHRQIQKPQPKKKKKPPTQKSPQQLSPTINQLHSMPKQRDTCKPRAYSCKSLALTVSACCEF